uniref:hypothetical protein n=1 Tax=Aeromonas media TaxID=651 RepID=UPI002B46F94C|nr:hypothetical protein [Aeromonas media]
MMKGWMKCGLAGAVVLMASFWGGSVRAAQMPLSPDGTLPGQIVAQAAALPSGTYFLSPGNPQSVAAGSGT